MDMLKINSALANLANTPIAGEREDLISRGKVLLLECVARAKNRALAGAGRPAQEFGYLTNSYDSEVRKWNDDVLYYVAKKTNNTEDRELDRNNRATFTAPSNVTNPMYLYTLAAVIRDVMYPVTPYLINEIVGEMCSVLTTPKGQTKQVEITSNAVIQWQDATWTSLRSVPADQLYNRTITLNPTPIVGRARINYYQMVGNNGNLIDTMAALAGGYAAKVMEKFNTAFTAAAADARYVPDAMKATGYTGDNWATLCQNVAAANRVDRSDLIGFGNFLALRKVVPDTAALASAIMMQLGNEYFKNGYIASHDNVLLYELKPVVKPGTINTTLEAAFPTDQIIIAARATERYAPMIMCWEDNGEALINLTPSDDVLATGNIDVMETASLEIAPAFASRVGIMSSIT